MRRTICRHLPLAEEIAATELGLPMYVGITDEELRYVIDAVNQYGRN